MEDFSQHKLHFGVYEGYSREEILYYGLTGGHLYTQANFEDWKESYLRESDFIYIWLGGPDYIFMGSIYRVNIHDVNLPFEVESGRKRKRRRRQGRRGAGYVSTVSKHTYLRQYSKFIADSKEVCREYGSLLSQPTRETRALRDHIASWDNVKDGDNAWKTRSKRRHQWERHF